MGDASNSIPMPQFKQRSAVKPCVAFNIGHSRLTHAHMYSLAWDRKNDTRTKTTGDDAS